MRTGTGIAQKLPKGGGGGSSSSNNNEFPRCGKQLAPELARGTGKELGLVGVVTFPNKGFSKKLFTKDLQKRLAWLDLHCGTIISKTPTHTAANEM